ncbi:hypothetical protein M0R45_003733 [Rubus argutus]|uniref:Secreted protein n=1 Tax=Rubus argutus TaxID=59490 RepID=A0AAW1YHN2_RUBAR
MQKRPPHHHHLLLLRLKVLVLLKVSPPLYPDQSRIVVARPVRGVVSTVDMLKVLCNCLCCWNHCWLYPEATRPTLG